MRGRLGDFGGGYEGILGGYGGNWRVMEASGGNGGVLRGMMEVWGRCEGILGAAVGIKGV